MEQKGLKRSKIKVILIDNTICSSGGLLRSRQIVDFTALLNHGILRVIVSVVMTHAKAIIYPSHWNMPFQIA